MDTAYYNFDSNNNKEDAEFLMVVYKFCRDNYIIPASNKYGVVGHSVMTITQAVQNVTKYQLKYNNKKYRHWCTYKEEEPSNKYSDNLSKIALSSIDFSLLLLQPSLLEISLLLSILLKSLLFLKSLL